MFGFKIVRVTSEEKRTTELEDLEQEKKDLKAENKRLEKDKTKLTGEVAQLELDAKIADEDIKHMVKMKTEGMELDFQKREVKADGERAEAVAKVKDDYQKKVEDQLKAEGAKMEKMYGQILERLPNVTMAIKQKD